MSCGSEFLAQSGYRPALVGVRPPDPGAPGAPCPTRRPGGPVSIRVMRTGQEAGERGDHKHPRSARRPAVWCTPRVVHRLDAHAPRPRRTPRCAFRPGAAPVHVEPRMPDQEVGCCSITASCLREWPADRSAARLRSVAARPRPLAVTARRRIGVKHDGWCCGADAERWTVPRTNSCPGPRPSCCTVSSSPARCHGERAGWQPPAGVPAQGRLGGGEPVPICCPDSGRQGKGRQQRTAEGYDFS